MHKRSVTILFIIFISLPALKFRCYKEPTPRPFDHNFEAAVDIFPVKKTYSLTDTIWIETDLPTKFLFDTKISQSILADTGNMSFGAGFNEFGTYITNPPNGFCDIITLNGVNINRVLSHWASSVTVNNFSCNRPDYKYRIGFKPNHKGTFHLSLPKDIFFESCPNKIVPYYALISFKYKNIDLGRDIFDALSKNDKGGNDGIKFYHQAIDERRFFVFKVN
ncbi:MAG: hypothetical protein ABIN74_00805 [Ferruginibacter sp.]